MVHVLVAGAGNIGCAIAAMLAHSGSYEVDIADIHFESTDVKELLTHFTSIRKVAMDVLDTETVISYLKRRQMLAVISALPAQCNASLAQAAFEAGVHYFDLTEDSHVVAKIADIAKHSSKAFVPQCGLAPGLVGMIANSMIANQDRTDVVHIRAGALFQKNLSPVHFAWSIDGVINAYTHACHIIENGESKTVNPLDGHELIDIEGQEYECFYTAGGQSHLSTLLAGQIREMNYKTIRRKGHRDAFKLLLDDLSLSDDKDLLASVLKRLKTDPLEDEVIIHLYAQGIKAGEVHRQVFTHIIYPTNVGSYHISAVQAGTAAGMCAVVDMILSQHQEYHGLIKQELLRFCDIRENRFIHYAFNQKQ